MKPVMHAVDQVNFTVPLNGRLLIAREIKFHVTLKLCKNNDR